MEWYNYLSAFWAGMFLANSVPHFVQGICGNKFPTVFSKPRGQGLSSPTTNIYWALINLLIGFVLFKVARISINNNLVCFIFFAGVATISLYASKRFSTKYTE